MDGATSTFLSTFLEALEHAISSCLVLYNHLMPEHPFIWMKAFIAALLGPQESNPGRQLSKRALYPLHRRSGADQVLLFCLGISRDALPWETWIRTLYWFTTKWKRKEEKRARHPADLNPWLHTRGACSTTVLQHLPKFASYLFVI